MTEHIIASHGVAPGAEFSPAEWFAFHADDIQSAKVVVMLMMGIFTMGLLIYSTVVFACTR